MMRRLITLLACLAVGGAAIGAQATRHRQLFPPENLGMLEAPDRAAWQKPEQIMDALNIADGARVADIGAGSGWFTIHLAQRVGPKGIVYAQDVQKPMLEAIRRRVQARGLEQRRNQAGHRDVTESPAGRARRGAGGRHLSGSGRGRPVTFLRSLASALKQKGRIGIVNYKPGRGGPGPDEGRVESSSVETDVRAAGLRVLSHETLPYQYLLVLGPLKN
jgi:SAM-dependent methyltransferase